MSNYDITFCRNDTCPRRRECHRWRHYQVYRRDRDKNKKTLISMFTGEGGVNCSMFWPANETINSHNNEPDNNRSDRDCGVPPRP